MYRDANEELQAFLKIQERRFYLLRNRADNAMDLGTFHRLVAFTWLNEFAERVCAGIAATPRYPDEYTALAHEMASKWADTIARLPNDSLIGHVAPTCLKELAEAFLLAGPTNHYDMVERIKTLKDLSRQTWDYVSGLEETNRKHWNANHALEFALCGGWDARHESITRVIPTHDTVPASFIVMCGSRPDIHIQGNMDIAIIDARATKSGVKYTFYAVSDLPFTVSLNTGATHASVSRRHGFKYMAP